MRYCQKLASIIKEPNIDGVEVRKLVEMLDIYIRTKTNLIMRKKLNPIAFANSNYIDESTAIKFMTICTKHELLSVRLFYNCSCDESIEIYNLVETTQCPNRCGNIPDQDRDNVYVYFQLLEKPELCKFIEHEKTQVDIMRETLGKELASVSDTLKVIGDDDAKILLSPFGLVLKQI